jgi:hypothetical protein
MGRLNIVVFDDMHRDCNGSFKRTGRDKNLEVTTTEVSRLSWLWMIYFCFLTPQVFTFGRSLRMIYFKVILAEQLYIFSSPAVYEENLQNMVSSFKFTDEEEAEVLANVHGPLCLRDAAHYRPFLAHLCGLAASGLHQGGHADQFRLPGTGHLQ